MKVPFLDLKLQFLAIEGEIRSALDEVLRSQQFILGPQVKQCEADLAAYCGCAAAVGVSSGTDALLVSLMAAEIGSGDEVLTTPYTFFATAGSIARLGARPVFVDINASSFNMCMEQVEERITARTRAIVPVHLFGQMCEMDPLLDIAGRHGLVVVEDAAQAIGAEYKGRRAGSLGHYGCFSFFPSKNLGCLGDGGAVVTQDESRAERVSILRAHGSKPKYYHRLVGGNFRLDTLQAAVVSAKLRHLEEWTEARRQNALQYSRLFEEAGLTGEGGIVLPRECTPRHVFNQYVVRAPNRDGLQAYLGSRGIGTEVYYPVPLHLQDCFADLGYQRGDFPASERAAKESLALPVYPELTREQAEYVVQCVCDFYAAEKVNAASFPG